TTTNARDTAQLGAAKRCDSSAPRDVRATSALANRA
ncbi:MAG: hypothetical protein JWQ82_1233, partial [Tardiphaga sp.]|nr:hypothetical protein [Tardiphaga sp.]